MRFGLLVALLGAFSLISPSFAQEMQGFRLLKLDGRPVKWGAQELGAGAAVTYAFVDTTMHFDNARNCGTMTPVDSVLDRDGVTRAEFEKQTAEAFALWAAAANISFRRSEDIASADILIGVEDDGRISAHADVLPDGANGGVGRIRRGLVCLSSGQLWKIGFGANPRAQDLRYTLAHEIGHAIGLDHPGRSGALMAYRYGEDFSELQPGDLAGAAALYGAPQAGAFAAAETPALSETVRLAP